MAWLADYSQISPRYLRQLFEKDTQHLKSIYKKLEESMDECEKLDFKENLKIVMGNKKL